MERLRAALLRDPQALGLPNAFRWPFVAGLAVVGAGWAFGGVLGVLALLGLYDFP